MKLKTGPFALSWFTFCFLFTVSISSPLQAQGLLDPNDPNNALGGAGESQAAVFPLSANLILSNSVGIGTFMPDYQRMPSWGSGLTLMMGVNVPGVGILPRGRLNLASSISVPWLLAFNGGNNANLNQPMVGDVRALYALGSVWRSSLLKLNVGWSGGASLPTSMRSRYNNLGTTLRTAVPISFSGLNPVSITWIPSFGYNVYTRSNPLTQRMNSEEEANAFLVVCRPQEVLGENMCMRRGRPSDYRVSNTIALGYGIGGGHSVGMSLTWSLGFLRALSDAPELKSQYASDQNFTESMFGSINYNYVFKNPLAPVLGLALSTGGPPYTPTGEMRFWFFDHITPSNNLTQIGLNLSWRM